MLHDFKQLVLSGYIFAGVMVSNFVQGLSFCMFLCCHVIMFIRLISHTSFPIIHRVSCLK